MAKSARASVRKRNNAKLRAKVFGPAYDARTERLSAKLQELANAPKPGEEKAMDVDDEKEEVSAEDAVATKKNKDEDTQDAATSKPSRKAEQRRSAGRIQKKVSRRKARAQMVFPSEIARRKRQAKARKA